MATKSKKEQKETVVEKTFEEALAEIDAGREVKTTQLEEGIKTLRTLMVKRWVNSLVFHLSLRMEILTLVS